MALITTGLTQNGAGIEGKTAHFQFSYDDSFSGPGGVEPARTNAVIAACENDYNWLSGLFGGGISITGINIQVTTQAADPCSYGAAALALAGTARKLRRPSSSSHRGSAIAIIQRIFGT
jgi:hypothetical protein